MNSLKPYKSVDDQKLHESKVFHYSTDQLHEYTHQPFQQELDQSFDQNSDLTLVGTADGYIHAIDQSTNKKLWSVDTGGPMISSSQTLSSSSSSSKSLSDDNQDDYTILPNIDGSILISDNKGMRKTSVKARLLAEKAPFMSNDGILFSSTKLSRMFSIDIDKGNLLDINSRHFDGPRGLKKKQPTSYSVSSLLPSTSLMNDKTSNSIFEKKKSLWIGRVDYTVRGYDGVTGEEKFNLTYSELKLTPLSNKAKRGSLATQTQTTPLRQISSSTSTSSSSSIYSDKGVVGIGSDDIPFLTPRSASLASTIPIPVISTPDGEIFFADSERPNHFSLNLGSPVTQAFQISKNMGNDILNRENFAEYDPDSSDYQVKPLKVGYKVDSSLEAKLNNNDQVLQDTECNPMLAVVRHLNDGGLYVMELTNEDENFCVEQKLSSSSSSSFDSSIAHNPSTSSFRSLTNYQYAPFSLPVPNSNNSLSFGLCIANPYFFYFKKYQSQFNKCFYLNETIKCQSEINALSDYMYYICDEYFSSTSQPNSSLNVNSHQKLIGISNLLSTQNYRSYNNIFEPFLSEMEENHYPKALPLLSISPSVFTVTGTTSQALLDKTKIGLLNKIIFSVDSFFVIILLSLCMFILSLLLLNALGMRKYFPKKIINIFDVYLCRLNLLLFQTETSIASGNIVINRDATTELTLNPNENKNEKHLPVSMDIDGIQMTQIGSLYVSDQVLGYGSQGTVVLLGNLNGRQVAVKRMLSQFTNAADREIALLIRSDGHPNVVRYFLREIKSEFVYLALQLCEMSLRDFISSLVKHQEAVALKNLHESKKQTLSFSDAFGSKTPKKSMSEIVPIEYDHPAMLDETRAALQQLANGLSHLHSKRIMHRDIKPHNILLAHIQDHPTKEIESIKSVNQIGKYVLKISDMGLSKQVEKESGSFASYNLLFGKDFNENSSYSSNNISAANPIGTIGWQAPELMSHRRNLNENNSNLANSHIDFKAADVFSLGCVIHFVIFSGKHPFGEWFEREANIMKSHISSSHMKYIPDAQDLISKMLNHDPKNRPTAFQISKHPFFWNSQKRLDFLISFSDRIEHEPLGSPIISTLESHASEIVGRNWDRKLHSSLFEDMGKYRKYDTSSVRDCLRVIRNKKNHFAELPLELKNLMSPIPEGFLLYFEIRFPRLFITCVSVVSTYLSNEKEFSSDFASIASLYNKFDNLAIPCIKNDDAVEQVFWCGESETLKLKYRGFWKNSISWENSFSNMHFKLKPKPSHLIKSSLDPKYRSRLCTHWEITLGNSCPMRKKGKCIFAHGPLELRIKESRKDRWGNFTDYQLDMKSSGGEDVLGAARSIEKIRTHEGSISERFCSS